MFIYPELDLTVGLRIGTILPALFYLAWKDWKTQIVPNVILIVLLCIRLVIYLLQILFNGLNSALSIFLPDILTAVVIAGFFLVFGLFIKNGMGMGDVKLIAVLSFYLGFKTTFISILFAMIFSFFVALYLLVVQKKSRNDGVPFVPFLLVGVIVGVNIVMLGVI
jgi:leader peptidase (prepilin peptidase)/N-methyltransferase